ncbi:hypothetical protein V490_00088 [Pseudogymnoascus sp. VKM F-3557]|nr:hypothetical protein V490_00088 [Pseudogymnoascus sp. VKM F-3557]
MFLLQSSNVIFRNGIFRHHLSRATITHDSGAVKIRLHLQKPLKVDDGQYVNLWIPSVSFWSFLQSHPFMVISWEPKEQHTLDLLIEPQRGLTQDLLYHAKKGHTINPIIMFNGPYGSRVAMDEYESILMVASGFGIAAHLPHLKRLIYGYNARIVRARRIHLVWQIRDKANGLAAQSLLNSVLDEDKLDDGCILEASVYLEYSDSPKFPFGNRATAYPGSAPLLEIFLAEVSGKYIKRPRIECADNSKALGKWEPEAPRPVKRSPLGLTGVQGTRSEGRKRKGWYSGDNLPYILRFLLPLAPLMGGLSPGWPHVMGRLTGGRWIFKSQVARGSLEIDSSMHSDQEHIGALATAEVIRLDINEISPSHLMSIIHGVGWSEYLKADVQLYISSLCQPAAHLQGPRVQRQGVLQLIGSIAPGFFSATLNFLDAVQSRRANCQLNNILAFKPSNIEMDPPSPSTACSDTPDTPNMSDDGEASIFEDIDGIISIIDAVIDVIDDKSNIPRNFKTLTRQPPLISKIFENIQTYVKTANETTKSDLALTIEKCKDKAMDLYNLFVPEDCYSQLDKSIQVIKGFLDNLQGIVTKFPGTTTPRSKEALAKAIKEVSQMESESFLNTDDLRRQTFTHFGSGPQNINTGNGIQYNEIQSNPVSRPPNFVRHMGLFAHFGSGTQNINTGNGTQYNSGGGNQKNGSGTQYNGTNFIA